MGLDGIIMKHYESLRCLRRLWETAVRQYQTGVRGARQVFTHAEQEELAALGHTAQEVYDFAEDYVNSGEPTLEDFIAIAAVRREYFLEVQGGRPSQNCIQMDQLPPKTASVRGLEWLPRLLSKARAKLRGQMPEDLMYGCGGDRRFFRTHDIHPAEFLRIVWLLGDNDEAIYDWVEARAKAAKP